MFAQARFFRTGGVSGLWFEDALEAESVCSKGVQVLRDGAGESRYLEWLAFMVRGGAEGPFGDAGGLAVGASDKLAGVALLVPVPLARVVGETGMGDAEGQSAAGTQDTGELSHGAIVVGTVHQGHGRDDHVKGIVGKDAEVVHGSDLEADTEGLSVLTAVAGGKLTETLVADSIKEFGVGDLVDHRLLVIPGYAAPLSGKIEDATGWKVLVGPRDAADLPGYLETEWKT